MQSVEKQQCNKLCARFKYDTAIYHSKKENGMLVLHALNKTHLVNMLQISTEMMIASMQIWQVT